MKSWMTTAISLVLFFSIPFSALALTPNDPLRDHQGYLDIIHAYDAWDSATGSMDVVVAVIDTGVDADHPDIGAHLWTNTDEVPDDGKDNDKNGFVDDVNGWDFYDDDNTPIPTVGKEFDEGAVSHGTFIAGIIGAVSDNEEGIIGINWDVNIMPLRILDSLGSGDSSKARRAIDYAVANGADVINLSFSGFSEDTGFLEAIENAYKKGVVVVAAVGNEGVSVNDDPIYPACFASENGVDLVIGVAATDDEDFKADFSNYGSQCTDLSAPGVEVVGALFQDDAIPELTGYYGGFWSGTSVAAPMVSGAAALLIGAYPTLTPSQVRSILKLSVDPVAEKGTPAAGQIGAGRLNIAQALAIAPQFASAAPASASSTSVEQKGSASLVVSAASGAPPTVTRFDSRGTKLNAFDAYAPSFTGGVRLAMGDFDGDGVDEIITGAGPGGGPHIRVFELDGTLHHQFFAYDSDVRHGVFVAAGDVDGDGVDEMIVSPDAGGNGEVRIFDKDGQRNFFLPFGNTAQSLRVDAGDIDGDGSDEIIVGLGAGGKPSVRVYEPDGTLVSSFDAYASTYDKGIFVATGDMDEDGIEEIVTGTDVGGGPHVRVFDAKGNVKGSFFAYDELFRGGVRVAVGDVDGDGEAEIFTGAGPGGGAHIRVFDETGKPLWSGFFADEKVPGPGVFLAMW